MTSTFARVFSIGRDDERVLARGAGADQPVCGLTVRSSAGEVEALVSGGQS